MCRMLYLSLGSNLGNRQQYLQEAIARLSQAIAPVYVVSNFVETDPWGFDSSHAFLNAVVAIKTNLSAEKILEITQHIERELGRNYKRKHGEVYKDRIIDIDILMLGDLVFHSPYLLIPHPYMHVRDFVLIPFAEIAPDIVHPLNGFKISQLLKKLD